MILGRRSKLTRVQQLARSLWPQRGFRRSLLYQWHRIARLNDTVHRIALGFACGVFMSFSPLLGIHVLAAALLAWVLRGNVLASAAGTLVGNPAAFPFIWVWIYRSGKFVLGENYMRHAPEPFTLSELLHRPFEVLQPILLPSLIGGTLSGIVAGMIAYGLVRAAVSGYQSRRLRRIARDRAMKYQSAPGDGVIGAADAPEPERKRAVR